MKKIPNWESGNLVRRAVLQSPVLSEFKASNLRGVWENAVYVVYSYETPIVVYSSVTNKYFETTEKFSVTTSKQQGQVTRYVRTQAVTQDDLLAIINDPTYIPMTTAQKAGVHVGMLCRVTRKGVHCKGSIVRVVSDDGWDHVMVEDVFAVRTEKWASCETSAIGVRLSQLEVIHDLEKES